MCAPLPTSWKLACAHKQARIDELLFSQAALPTYDAGGFDCRTIRPWRLTRWPAERRWALHRVTSSHRST